MFESHRKICEDALKETPNNEAVLIVKVPNGSIKSEIEFKAYDFDYILFKDKKQSGVFVVLLNEYLDNTDWPKKILARAYQQNIDGEEIWCLQIRIWVEDEFYAKSFNIASAVIWKRLKGGLDMTPIDVSRKLSEYFLEGGWTCRCGHVNLRTSAVCLKCLETKSDLTCYEYDA